MNNVSNMMLRRDGSGVQAQAAQNTNTDGVLQQAGYGNSAMMLRREDVAVQAQLPVSDDILEEKDIPDIPVFQEMPVMQPAQPAPQAKPQQASQPVQLQPGQQKQAAGKSSLQQVPQAAKPAVAQPVRHLKSPDELCQAYVQMFRSTLGLDLSMSICFENMRKMCEVDVKDPCGTLYFLENTYRVSTILYLAGNLPILFVASILAEKNRKNILKYVTIEVENGSKPYADLLELRQRRWMRKYEGMAVNDAMTVTPGATSLTPELAAKAAGMLEDICRKLRKFNKEMSKLVAAFDDGARNDVVFIYSNWWYLLQGFENVPEMRTYLMSVTDDTRKNLKL